MHSCDPLLVVHHQERAPQWCIVPCASLLHSDRFFRSWGTVSIVQMSSLWRSSHVTVSQVWQGLPGGLFSQLKCHDTWGRHLCYVVKHLQKCGILEIWPAFSSVLFQLWSLGSWLVQVQTSRLDTIDLEQPDVSGATFSKLPKFSPKIFLKSS